MALRLLVVSRRAPALVAEKTNVALRCTLSGHLRNRGLGQRRGLSGRPPPTEGESGAKGGQLQVSIIEQTTALDKGGRKLTIGEDIMLQPTLAGKVYTGSTYALQMCLALGGAVMFGGIAYALYGNMGKRTSPTAMFNMSLGKINKHPMTEVELGMPIKGIGGPMDQHHQQYRKPNDPTLYTYSKYQVIGKKADGIVHAEYADNTLHYVLVQVPKKGTSFAIEDNRAGHTAEIAEWRKEAAAEAAESARKAAEAPLLPQEPSSLSQPMQSITTQPVASSEGPLLPLDSGSKHTGALNE